MVTTPVALACVVVRRCCYCNCCHSCTTTVPSVTVLLLPQVIIQQKPHASLALVIMFQCLMFFVCDLVHVNVKYYLRTFLLFPVHVPVCVPCVFMHSLFDLSVVWFCWIVLSSCLCQLVVLKEVGLKAATAAACYCCSPFVSLHTA